MQEAEEVPPHVKKLLPLCENPTGREQFRRDPLKYLILAQNGSMRYFTTMQTITDKLVNAGLANRLITVSQLDRLVGGSPQRRYGLVNRAIKAGELIRLQRGLYGVSTFYRDAPCHPFALAQALAPGSYVSFETALAYHGWIPEAVITTASVVTGRKSRKYEHEKLGLFTFHPLAIQQGYFLELVVRYQVDGQTMLVADPLRALMDLVCLRKIPWQGMKWFWHGLRVDPELLANIDIDDIRALKMVYKHKRMESFLTLLCRGLNID